MFRLTIRYALSSPIIFLFISSQYNTTLGPNLGNIICKLQYLVRYNVFLLHTRPIVWKAKENNVFVENHTFTETYWTYSRVPSLNQEIP